MTEQKRGTGRIIMGDELEAVQTDMLAAQMLEQVLGSNALVGERIQYVRIHDNIGWHKRAIVIQLESGHAIRITGENMTVQEFAHGVSTEQLDREDQQLTTEVLDAEAQEVDSEGRPVEDA